MNQLASKVVLDERKIIAEERELEGKTYLSREDGGIFKENRIPVCDICYRRSENFNACSSCKKKLCDSCSISFHNRIYCIVCLDNIIRLTKREYKILTAIANNIQSNVVADIAKIRKDDMKACETNLLEKGMVEKKGFLFFQKITILDTGLEAIDAYHQVYGKEGDVVIFEEAMRRLIVGES